MTILLQVDELAKTFALKGGGAIQAVHGVSFAQAAGEVIGIVGESGCGKSTLGRLVLQLVRPSAGSVRFRGKDLTLLSETALRPLRRHLQMIFQDPYAALDPRMRIGTLLEEPLVIHRIGTRAERSRAVAELLETCGLAAETVARYPHELSGGQRQRVCIARALALSPELVVADEPVSALDVSIQSQILNLLMALKRSRGLAYLFISHNLAVVKYVSDRLAVMYLGRIVEMGSADVIYADPRHPYTRALIAAVPEPEPDRQRMRTLVPQGELPSPERPPSGCRFHPRCPEATSRCRSDVPKPMQVGSPQRPHWVECHLYSGA
jgi:oligopeptide/dipeptide ABC transporter ATP-binding protein